MPMRRASQIGEELRVAERLTPLLRGEHQGRSTLPERVMADSEALWGSLVAFSLVAYNRANHYDRFRVASVMPAYDEKGNPKLLSGANFRPDKRWRVCAEAAMLASANDGDMLGDIVVVRGPEIMKPIEGCREMKSLHSCVTCRPALANATSPETLVVTMRGVEDIPQEAFTVRQLINYHDGMGEYPEMPQGMTALDVAMNALDTMHMGGHPTGSGLWDVE